MSTSMLFLLALLVPSPILDDEEKDAAWDVDAPEGPSREITIDAGEGTWMSLDVSPDGKTVVFDLLGDLYTVPIGGGDATPLTEGIAWDMQPRFSPDGTRVAFTSDAGGGDNLWVVDADGRNRRAVTKETFRLVTSPGWSPDGTYLVGRKHFTSRRSLGAGEMWLYHVHGDGSGLQMTTKPSEQKDVGEPAFSPDGRYLYYSYDASPGGTFAYNKDSNGQIYVIARLDRETGEGIDLVTGPGGAARPTPSPDGNWLAFVRRVRFQTTLFLLDLRSGVARPVYDRLERDMQETWAIHGVYPTMAWTPDSSSIVLWAKGKIHRVDTTTGAATEIPFRVRSTRTIQPAVRFEQEAAPSQVDVKCLRWVRVSPDGTRVVYQALGHLYVKELPDGAPRRLTKQNDRFEFSPSFSRDGKWIVYVAWDDDSLASVEVVSADGGEGRALTTDKGHYVDPAISPDGEMVVYGKVSGGYLTSPAWSLETGLYRVPFEGGNAERVTKRGTNPQFGKRSDRVFLMTVEPNGDVDRRALISVGLDGKEERTHLVSEAATEYAVSPDEEWVAFIERYHAYVVPLAPIGREVKVGPNENSIPKARVTKDTGENLQWSGDGTKLHWSLGPTLYTRALTDSFAFLDGAPETLPEPPTEGIAIGFTHDGTGSAAGTTALIGGRVVTMRGDEVIEDGTVIVEGNRIAKVGPRADVEVPAGAQVVNAAGTTIMPGIIDVHAHGGQASDAGVTPRRNWIHHANLAFGVTTIHDPSNDTNAIFAVSELAKAGMVLSPRTFSTGTILYGAAGSFKAEIDGLDDARFHLRRLKSIGAFSVKSYNQPRRDQRQQVIQAARELGMHVYPEGGSTFMHNLTMVVDGHTGVEHSLPVERIYQDVVQLWGASEVGYTPTLIVGYGGIWGENYFYDTANVWENERLMTFVPRFVVDPRSRRRTRAPAEEYNTLKSAAICRALLDGGARCQLGAHGQLAGLGAHWELWLLKEGGLTNHEALRAATLDGARYLGMETNLGSIETGKLADLIVLDENPLDDIRNSEHVRYTMLDGRMYDSRTMKPAFDEHAETPRFFWSDMQNGLPAQVRIGGCVGCMGTGHEHERVGYH